MSPGTGILIGSAELTSGEGIGGRRRTQTCLTPLQTPCSYKPTGPAVRARGCVDLPTLSRAAMPFFGRACRTVELPWTLTG